LSGREAGRTGAHAGDPELAEVVSGTVRENLQGLARELASADDLRQALEQAFDYRGDVTITRRDGSKAEGYIFDRRSGTSLTDSFVRLLPKDGGGKISISFADVAGLEFTGRDMAAGKNWENWVRQYWEKKAAGEKNISLQPEKLE
jgi:hypothetical protein